MTAIEELFRDVVVSGIGIGIYRIDPKDFFNQKEQQMHDIEQDIQAKGLTAPRVTPDTIAANIAAEFYFTASNGVIGANSAINGPILPPLTLLTFCVLVLQNGFTVTGESACASPENYDPAIGRKIARENATQKIWPLMGYELRTKLAQTVDSEGGEL